MECYVKAGIWTDEKKGIKIYVWEYLMKSTAGNSRRWNSCGFMEQTQIFTNKVRCPSKSKFLCTVH